MGGGGEGGYPTFQQLIHYANGRLCNWYFSATDVCATGGSLWPYLGLGYPLGGGGSCGDLRYLWGCTPG